jgi:hypothetical protein
MVRRRYRSKKRGKGVQEVRNITPELLVWSGTPEVDERRRKRRPCPPESEKKRWKRRRFRLPPLDSVGEEAEDVEAVPKVVSTRWRAV